MEIVIYLLCLSLFWSLSYCYLEQPTKLHKTKAHLVYRYDARTCLLRFADGMLHKWTASSDSAVDKISGLDTFNLFYRNYDIYFYDKLIYPLPLIVFGISIGLRSICSFIACI